MIGPISLPVIKSRRAAILAAAVAATGLAAPTALASAAASPSPGTARLQGTFALTGRVTVAVHVTGEYPGQAISRTWTFEPLCSTGACASIRLIRSRIAGTDVIVLHSRAPGAYRGTGTFYAPLRCGGQLHSRGEAVPFKISVRITAAAVSAGVPVATTISARYTNRKRVNLTRCVALPSHDAALYTGTLQSGA